MKKKIEKRKTDSKCIQCFNFAGCEIALSCYKYENFKPQPESKRTIEIEITRGQFTGNTFNSNILFVYDRYSEELKKLIPKGQTRKFILTENKD